MLDIEYDNGGLLRGHPFDKDWEANPGAVIGLSYDFENGLIIGAKYRTPISMTYDNSAGGQDLTLQQPGEFGVGFSYNYGAHTIAFDYKRIQWGSATGYADFGWEDQDVYAVGYQYEAEDWAFRMGYNHGKSPIDTSRTANWQDYLNLLGFPATAEDHYTIGFSYTMNASYSLDFAAVYSPEKTVHGTVIEAIPVKISNQHSELSFTAQLNYKF
jgi:long-chain fatty acid transport protein